MSRNVIVFGSHGKVGQRLVRIISESNKYSGTAVVRNAQQAQTIQKLTNGAVSTKEFDLTESSVDEISKIIKGQDAVVISVGSAGKDLLKVDLDGVVKAFEATVKANVRRLVLVSAVLAQSREFGAESPIRNYYIARHYADRILQNEFQKSLDYTILRPTALTDGEGTGKISFVHDKKEITLIDREDVARALYEVLDLESTFGKAYDFTSGDKPIADKATWA